MALSLFVGRGKLFNFLEIFGFGYYTGMKMFFKGWRGFREVILGRMFIGGFYVMK